MAAKILIIVVLYMVGTLLVNLLKIENNASQNTAIRINKFPFIVLLVEKLEEPNTLNINRPKTTNIIPITLFVDNSSLRKKNASKPNIAGEILVINPLSTAEVSFNPKKRKVLNKKTPVKACINKIKRVLGLICGICFLFIKVNRDNIIEAIIRLHSEARKIGNV